MQTNKQSLVAVSRPQLNRGAVLFASLIILLVLTILGLSAMNNSRTELQTASNTQEKNIANQAAQAGLNAVMCLADDTKSGTSDENPFDKTYVKINVDGTIPGLMYNWDWDKSYDNQNINPFADMTSSSSATAETNCSLSSGSLSIGTGVSTDLAVATRRSSDSASLRAINGNSYKEVECQNYVIDSRYEFQASGAKAYVWAGVCKEKIDN